MIGYKVFSMDANGNLYSVNGLKKRFVIGKTYTFEGELVPGKSGYHFCKNFEDIFDMYPTNSVIAVVKIKGYAANEKICCTANLRIEKILSQEDIEKFCFDFALSNDVNKRVLAARLTKNRKLLRYLSNDRRVAVRVSVADNSNTEYNVLEKFCESSNLDISRAAEMNPEYIKKNNISKYDEKKLIKLAKAKGLSKSQERMLINSSFAHVRAEFCKNTDNILYLKKMCYDNSPIVRQAVAKNKHINSNEDICEELYKDKDYYVVANLINNPSVSDYWKNEALKKKRCYQLLVLVISDYLCPEEILKRLSTYKEEIIRYTIASHPNTPKETMEMLLNDSSFAVREMAKNMLAA